MAELNLRMSLHHIIRQSKYDMTLGVKKIIEIPSTISETIYRYLKKAVIEGELKPNQRLQEKEIANLFRASTTPVREAFQRLSAEKYIIINARKDVLVASATLEEIMELFEVVRVLDTFASKKAVNRLTDKEIADLRKMTERLGNFYKKKKINDYVRENLRIHYKIWKACANKFLYQSLVNLGEKYTFFGNQVFFLANEPKKQPSFFDQSYKDHINLMKAIEKRDVAQVETILISHWGKGFLGEEETGP